MQSGELTLRVAIYLCVPRLLSTMLSLAAVALKVATHHRMQLVRCDASRHNLRVKEGFGVSVSIHQVTQHGAGSGCHTQDPGGPGSRNVAQLLQPHGHCRTTAPLVFSSSALAELQDGPKGGAVPACLLWRRRACSVTEKLMSVVLPPTSGLKAGAARCVTR